MDQYHQQCLYINRDKLSQMSDKQIEVRWNAIPRMDKEWIEGITIEEMEMLLADQINQRPQLKAKL